MVILKRVLQAIAEQCLFQIGIAKAESFRYCLLEFFIVFNNKDFIIS